MGDRGNVAIVDANSDSVLVFYAHWAGYNLPELVANAVGIAKPRWSDTQYFNRIVLHNLMNSVTTPDSDAGAGISVGYLRDNGYPIIVVDPSNRFVGCVSEGVFNSIDWSFDWFYVEDRKIETIDFEDLTARSLTQLRDRTKR